MLRSDACATGLKVEIFCNVHDSDDHTDGMNDWGCGASRKFHPESLAQVTKHQAFRLGFCLNTGMHPPPPPPPPPPPALSGLQRRRFCVPVGPAVLFSEAAAAKRA